MIKIFRIPADSEMLFQTSLIERELNEMMNMRRVKKVLEQSNEIHAETNVKIKPGQVFRRPIESGDIWYVFQGFFWGF